MVVTHDNLDKDLLVETLLRRLDDHDKAISRLNQLMGTKLTYGPEIQMLFTYLREFTVHNGRIIFNHHSIIEKLTLDLAMAMSSSQLAEMIAETELMDLRKRLDGVEESIKSMSDTFDNALNVCPELAPPMVQGSSVIPTTDTANPTNSMPYVYHHGGTHPIEAAYIDLTGCPAPIQAPQTHGGPVLARATSIAPRGNGRRKRGANNGGGRGRGGKSTE